MKRRPIHRRLSAWHRARSFFEGLEPRLVLDGVVDNDPETVLIEQLSQDSSVECFAIELSDDSRRGQGIGPNGEIIESDCDTPTTVVPPSLQHFANADELQQHLILQAVEQWKDLFGAQVPHYYPPGYYEYFFAETLDLRSVDGPHQVVNALADVAYSNTNVQVAGVDEGDLVKSDGQYLFLARENRLTIVDARDPGQLQIVSRISLDHPAGELYVDGNRLTVISSHYPITRYGGGMVPAIAFIDSFGYSMRWEPNVAVEVYDITDRSAPREIASFELDGGLVQSRAIGSQIVLVTQNDATLPRPEAHCENQDDSKEDLTTIDRRLANGLFGDEWLPVQSCVYETKEEYVARVSEGLLEQILPHYTTGGDDQSAVLLTTPESIAASGPWQQQLVSTTVINVGGEIPRVADSAGILTSFASQVYATAEHVYVATPDWSANVEKTRIVEFSLGEEQDSVAVTGVGQVPGHLLNQFSMDAHDGYLRLATSEGWGPSATNSVFVLQRDGEQLAVVGSVTGITPGETIFAARFLGDQAFLVTFERIDPLVALDLSDPANPVVVGELEIPGFSNYLHPLAGGYLIGLGRDANTENGWATDPQISLFDVHDLSSPSLVDREIIGVGSNAWSQAFVDHHAISFFEDVGVFAVPFNLPDWLAEIEPPAIRATDIVRLKELLERIPDENGNRDTGDRDIGDRDIGDRDIGDRIRRHLANLLDDISFSDGISREELARIKADLPDDVTVVMERLRGSLSAEHQRLIESLLRDGNEAVRPHRPRTGLWVFHIDPSAENPIEHVGTITHEQPVERSLRIGNALFSVSNDLVTAHDLTHPDQPLGRVYVGRLVLDDFVTVDVDDGPARLDVLANDRVTDEARIVAVSQPEVHGGHVTISEDGRSVVYIASTNLEPTVAESGRLILPPVYGGNEWFTYTVQLADGMTETATVTIQQVRERVGRRMAELAQHDLAKRLEIRPEQVRILKVEPRQWNDGCLGSPNLEPVCLQAVTPGFVVWLSALDRRFEYHSDSHATVILVGGEIPPKLDLAPDHFRVRQESSDNVLDVMANDFPDIQFIRAPRISAVGQTDRGGTVTITEGGLSLLYTPAVGFHGTETFTYTVDNGLSGKVTVRVLGLELPPDDPGQSDPTARKMAELAQQDLARRLEIRSDQVQVLRVQQREWPNSCLGVPNPDQGCAEVVTPGFVVWLTADNRRYEYHTDTEATVILVEHDTPDRDGVIPDVFRVRQDSSASELDVLANDFPNIEFIKAPRITAVSRTDQGGTVTITEGGFSLLYTPAPGFHGAETFTYTVDNGPSGKVTVRVVGRELPPVEPGPNDPLIAIRLEVTDADGNPLSQVELGAPFFIDVFVNDLREEAQGVFGAYMDVAMDTGLAAVRGAIDYSTDYNNGVSGAIDRSGIDELGAFTSSLPPLGAGERLLVRIPLEAIAVGNLSIATNPADLLPQHHSALYGTDAVVPLRRIDYGTVGVRIVNGFHNDVEPTDSNGDGTTSSADALQIINWINEHGAGSVMRLREAEMRAMADGLEVRRDARRFDTNGDGHCTHMDVLMVFNRINSDFARRATANAEASPSGPLLVDAGGSQFDSAENLVGPREPGTGLIPRSRSGLSSTLEGNHSGILPTSSNESGEGESEWAGCSEEIEGLLDDLTDPSARDASLDVLFAELG